MSSVVSRHRPAGVSLGAEAAAAFCMHTCSVHERLGKSLVGRSHIRSGCASTRVPLPASLGSACMLLPRVQLGHVSQAFVNSGNWQVVVSFYAPMELEEFGGPTSQ